MALQGRILDGEELGALAERREDGGVGAGQPGLGAERAQLLEQRGAARGVEMGRDLVEQQDRLLLAGRRAQPRLGQDQAIRSAFCWPVEQSRAGRPEARSWTTRSLRCGPTAVVPVSASCAPRRGKRLGEALLGVERRQLAQPALDLPVERELGLRKPAGGSIRAALEAAHGLPPGRGDRDAGGRDLALQRASQDGSTRPARSSRARSRRAWA